MNPRAILGFGIVGVYVIILFGAARTFRRVERAWRTQLLAISFWIYAAIGMSAELFLPGLVPGLLLLAAGLALFEWSAYAVRGRFFSIMGTRDTPEFVFDQGPFGYIRHPFYTSYLLMHTGVTVMFPSVVTLLTLLGTAILVWNSALLEERKFARSPLHADYRAYMARTGRFWPRMAARGAS